MRLHQLEQLCLLEAVSKDWPHLGITVDHGLLGGVLQVVRLDVCVGREGGERGRRVKGSGSPGCITSAAEEGLHSQAHRDLVRSGLVVTLGPTMAVRA